MVAVLLNMLVSLTGPSFPQGNRRVKDVNEPNAKSVWGRAVEIRPRSCVASSCYLLLLTFKQGRISVLFGDPLGRAFGGSCLFFKWSDIEGSGRKSLTVCCPNPPLCKGISSVLGLGRPPLVLLLISSGVLADLSPSEIS